MDSDDEQFILFQIHRKEIRRTFSSTRPCTLVRRSVFSLRRVERKAQAFHIKFKSFSFEQRKTFAKHQEVLILLARNQSVNQMKKNINYKTHTMETNENLREQIFEIINSQLKTNNPPETKLTFDRLINQGFDDFQVKQMIGQCLSVELFEILKFGKTYNNERYIKNLKKLPKEPFD